MSLTEARLLANTLMLTHGLNNWQFEFDNAKRRFGCCHYSLRRITISRTLTELNTAERVTNTLLHEIAHALAPRTSGHDATWRRIAISIGCDGERLYSAAEVETPKKPFSGTCPSCNRTILRHQRRKIACGACCNRYNHGRFDAQYLFNWTRI